MEEVIVQIAVQVPAVAILAYTFLRIFDKVMDVYAKKIDRLADAIEDMVRLLRS